MRQGLEVSRILLDRGKRNNQLSPGAVAKVLSVVAAHWLRDAEQLGSNPEMVKNLPGGSVGFEMSARPDPLHRALDCWVLTSFASTSRGNYYYLFVALILDRNGFITVVLSRPSHGVIL